MDMVIQSFAFLMAFRYLQTFFPPQALHFLVIDPPALDVQQSRDLAIALPAILLGQSYQGEAQFFVIILGNAIDTAGASFTGA